MLADETTNVAGHEQLTVIIRYVHSGDIREQFIRFLQIEDLTGAGLANNILSVLHESGIDTNITKLVDQGYDGANSMSGEFRGAQAVVHQSHLVALYVHCAAHVLNFTISKASEVQLIRNSSGVMSQVIVFFRGSPKRTALLQRLTAISELHESGSKHLTLKLKKLCDTR